MAQRARLWYLSPLIIMVVVIASMLVLSSQNASYLWVAAGLLAWIQLFAAERKRGLDWKHQYQPIYYIYIPLIMGGPFSLLFVARKLALNTEGGDFAAKCSAD